MLTISNISVVETLRKFKKVDLSVCFLVPTETGLNKSIMDVNGSILAISQFTLCGDLRKGRRPSYIKSADPELAKLLYQCFINRLLEEGVPVKTGKFGAEMSVSLINEGPATFYLKSSDL